MAEPGPPAAHSDRSRVGQGFTVLVALATLALLALISLRVAQQPVSFDGAMNLQVASHLAYGGGYERPYSSIRPFPHEVQTNAPFILVAAAVFALFGVGLVKAQATNLLYLYGLCALAGGTVRVRHGPGPWPWLAVLAILTTPGLVEWGMNGYGEIPGLAWWLLGTLLLFLLPRGRGVLLAVGGCLGLALLTKTVMLMPLGCSLAVWGLWRLIVQRPVWKSLLSEIGWILTGLLLPILAFELWRFVSVDGWAGYVRWWSWELNEIQMQAGVSPGFEDTPDRLEKFRTHFDLLIGFLDLSKVLTVVWLLLPLLLAVASLPSLRAGHRWLIVAVLLTVVAYFAWWLLLTPTQKAWHRRILNGMVLVQLMWVHVAWWLWCRWRPQAVWRHVGRGLIAILLVLVLAHGLQLRLEQSLIPRDISTFRAGVRHIQTLPKDAMLMGQGWYSAPAIQLYSGHRIWDLNLLAVAELEGEVFVVRDAPAREAGALQLLLDAYEYEELIMESDFELYRIDTTRRRQLIPDFDAGELRGVDRVVTKEGPYALSRGVTSDRWAGTLVELILEAQGPVSAIRLETFTPAADFVNPPPVRVRVVVNGCDIGRHDLVTPGTSYLDLPIPPDCPIGMGEPVRISLESDNMVWPRDQRQLSYILKELALRYAD